MKAVMGVIKHRLINARITLFGRFLQLFEPFGPAALTEYLYPPPSSTPSLLDARDTVKLVSIRVYVYFWKTDFISVRSKLFILFLLFYVI
jgi:hypothetical protein